MTVGLIFFEAMTGQFSQFRDLLEFYPSLVTIIRQVNSLLGHNAIALPLKCFGFEYLWQKYLDF